MEIDVKHVAELARLRLSEEDMKRLGEDLKSILRHIGSLKAVDVEGVEPTYSVGGIRELVLDRDLARPGLNREELLGLAPSSQGPYFSVPREGAMGEAPEGSE